MLEASNFEESTKRKYLKPILVLAIYGAIFLFVEHRVNSSILSGDQVSERLNATNKIPTTTTGKEPGYEDESIELDPTDGSAKHSIAIKPKFCSRERIRKGEWKAVRREKPLYALDEDAWENKCYQKKQTEKPAIIDSWEWIANENGGDDKADCSFAPFEVHRFCQLNSNRTIAFLGDSISWQQFNSLNYLLGATDEYRTTATIKINGVMTGSINNNACSGNTKLLWLRDNRAKVSRLHHIIGLYDPDVIVLNRGAHYVESSVLRMELNLTLGRALEWQRDCDKRGGERDCLLVWRTTAPGFPDCENTPGPIGIDRQAMAKDTVSDPSHPWYQTRLNGHKFHWWDFAGQNAIVEDLFQSRIRQGLRVSFLDFYEMAILRPDLHIGKGDCLHYCLPGPHDAVNAVLLHEMEVARSTRKSPFRH
uniref:Trichome birefringence-like C-terminal domain-containing protein n=1 Tax=Pseudo-nitzschia multistriata TaxID=183589 RepID=A0A448ZJR5_9STRA